MLLHHFSTEFVKNMRFSEKLDSATLIKRVVLKSQNDAVEH